MPVTLADSVRVWPRLFTIAKDESIPSQTRKDALFWIGQAAADKISPPETRYAVKGNEDEEVKKSAVFALSQRRNGEAVPALIQIARNNRDPEVRKSALFWLGQTADPRAISLFEEILGRD
jgi:HEAT repeat protein